MSGELVYRLKIHFPGKEVNLGVLIPADDGFSLEKSLPVSHFSQVPTGFTVCVKHSELSGRFAPIYPEEPFSYIEHLKNAYLAKKNDQLGIIFK